MSNQVFQQNLNDKKGPQPGGPYLIQMLFKEPVEMPDKDTMTAVMEKHIGSAECFCYDDKMAGFAALDHIAEFQDGKCPVQLMVMKCDRFKGKGFDAFLLSQMWDCQEDRERIFRECRYQVVATDTSSKKMLLPSPSGQKQGVLGHGNGADLPSVKTGNADSVGSS